MRIRYYCHAGLPTGFGRAATHLALAMARHRGVELDLRPMGVGALQSFGLPVAPWSELAPCIHRPGTPDVVIVHTLPLDCPRVLQIERIDPLKTPTIAYTTIETISMPSRVHAALSGFGKIWMPSLTRRSGTHDDVDIVPHTFDATGWTRPAPRPSTEGGRYRFYTIGAWYARKNVEGLIQAYCHAFTIDDPVELRIHSENADRDKAMRAIATTGLEQASLPLISFSTGILSDDKIDEIHRDHDCFVSASHGEAWNLPAFEALLAGRQVIVPKHHGSDEYLRHTNARRYPSRPAPVAFDVGTVTGQAASVTGAQGTSVKDLWREPSLVDLALEMQALTITRVPLVFFASSGITDRGEGFAAAFRYETVASLAVNLLQKAIDAHVHGR